jgi:hypothetical protein
MEDNNWIPPLFQDFLDKWRPEYTIKDRDRAAIAKGALDYLCGEAPAPPTFQRLWGLPEVLVPEEVPRAQMNFQKYAGDSTMSSAVLVFAEFLLFRMREGE